MSRQLAWLLVPAVLGGAMLAPGTPQYRHFTIPISKLEIVEGFLPPPRYGNQVTHGDAIELFNEWTKNPSPFRAVLNGPGSIESIVQSGSGGVSWDHVFLAIQTTQDGPLSGQFEFWKDKEFHVVKWKLPKDANTVRAAEWFKYGQAKRIERTIGTHLGGTAPGQAWFRHRVEEIDSLKTPELASLWAQLARADRKTAPNEPDIGWVPRVSTDRGSGRWRGNRGNGDISELVSGGRAIAENLQLDRDLNLGGSASKRPTVDIAELKGIDVKEYDWAPHIKNIKPELDLLASMIPADQHAVFFPDMPTGSSVYDEIKRTGLAVWNVSTANGVDEQIGQRYLKQLALPATELGKLMPASLVNGVAVTGSDLYFDTGTDVAVLMASPNPALVSPLIKSKWPAIKSANADVEEKDETIADIKCRTLKSPDRRICAIVAELKWGVVVTNSLAQIQRLGDVQNNRTPNMAGLAEYAFFRHRYPRDNGESAFVMLTDAAIRRWCGPKWRIAHHRRLQTGALLADAQAAHLETMLKLKAPQTVDDPRLGAIELTTNGAYSKVHGTRLFQRPIAEAELNKVTAAEADGYREWRDGYQKNWAKFFDPIAIQLTAKPDRLALDVSVIPLIAETSYRDLIALTTGAKLSPTSGDPHPEAIVHYVVGLNRNAPEFHDSFKRRFGDPPTKTKIESWLGDWISVYADDDPLWDKFVRHEKEEWKFWSEHKWQIPVGVALGVHDAEKRDAFVAELRDLARQHTDISEKSYAGVNYHGYSLGAMFTIYSLSTPEMWLLTPNENVMKRAIDRHVARKDGKKEQHPNWLGDSTALRIQPKGMHFLREWWGRDSSTAMQQAAWNNIPILNEWRRLAPEVDPVVFHEKWWGEKLTDTAGGQYVWNIDDRTLESNMLGHPGRPKGSRAMMPAALVELLSAEFGLTFEKDGLRAKMNFQRK